MSERITRTQVDGALHGFVRLWQDSDPTAHVATAWDDVGGFRIDDVGMTGRGHGYVVEQIREHGVSRPFGHTPMTLSELYYTLHFAIGLLWEQRRLREDRVSAAAQIA